LEFFKSSIRAVIYRTIVDFPALLEHGSAKKITVCAHTNRDPNKQEVGFSLYEAAQNFELEVFSKKQLKTKIKNKKTYCG
jgi:hypothetical protein